MRSGVEDNRIGGQRLIDVHCQIVERAESGMVEGV
jgi:hypothetical protein